MGVARVLSARGPLAPSGFIRSAFRTLLPHRRLPLYIYEVSDPLIVGSWSHVRRYVHHLRLEFLLRIFPLPKPRIIVYDGH